MKKILDYFNIKNNYIDSILKLGFRSDHLIKCLDKVYQLNIVNNIEIVMVDVTDIPDVAVRDEVILIGSDNGACISVEEVAAPAASFNYELVCNVARRVPRVYSENGKDVLCVNYLL